MEPVRAKRANNQDVERGLAGKIVQFKDKAEDAAAAARVKAAAGVADRVKVAVARDAVKGLDAAKIDGFLPSPTQQPDGPT